MASERIKQNGYRPGHPWYYVCGGAVLPPKAILQEVQRRGYRGYMAHRIERIDSKPEPQRSHALRVIKAEVMDELRDNLSRYRECARELAAFRRGFGSSDCAPLCENIHTNICLKHNHLYNDFAHLIVLDELLSAQPDFFDL